MTIFKNDTLNKYLLYCLKNSIIRNLTLTVISIVYLFTRLQNAPLNQYNCTLQALTWILISLSFIMPILTFSRFNNKRNLDSIYSLPISRKQIITVHYISGIISMFAVYSACYLVYLGYLFVSKADYQIGFALIYFLLSFFYGVVIYSFYSFVFTQANTNFDGIVFSITWTFVFIISCIATFLFIYDLTGFEDFSDSFVMSLFIQNPLLDLGEYFTILIEAKKYVGCTFPVLNKISTFNIFVAYPVWTLIGSLGLFGMLKLFSKKAADKAGEISESIFGYKLLIPLVGFSFIYMSYIFDNIIPTAVVFVITTVWYFIYRRGFRLKKSDIIILIFGVLAVLKTLI